jgi:large subunit ribosomal protein L30e
MSVDIDRAIRKAIKNGKVYLGSKKTLKALRGKEAKMVIVASNCPRNILEQIENSDVPVYRYEGTNIDLGAACGKPFSVLTLAVVDPGDSEILQIQ